MTLNRNCILLLKFILSFTPVSQASLPDTTLVALVNGESVVLDEFILNARHLRPVILYDFRDYRAEEPSSDFWFMQINGSTPMETLKKRALDTLVRIKVQQLAAQKAGIIQDISYQGFLKALQEENKRRYKEKQTGGMIYGPVQYSEEVYFNYLFTNMVCRLKEHLAATVFQVTDVKLKDGYNQEKKILYNGGYYSKVRLIAQKPGEREEIMDVICNDSVYYPEEHDPLMATVKGIAGKLEQGQCSRAINFQGIRYIICVTEKIPLGYRSFESCRTTVRKRLVDQMYEQYILEMVKEASCEVNTDVYNGMLIN